MKDYPRLAEMGVLHPGQIIRYSVNSIDYVDYLRISYKRPEGSMLPVVRSYEFPRRQKQAGGGAESAVVMESNPEFKEAVAELEQILSAWDSTQTLAENALAELAALEEGVAHHTACLRDLVEKLKQVPSAQD